MTQPVAIRFGTLHDHCGEPKRNGTLVIENGRIAALAAPDAAIPANAIEYRSACVVPGLINAHAHFEMSGEPQTMGVFVLTTPTQRALACAENARKALHSGVTAARDLGSTENLAIDLRDAIAAGRIPGPAIVAAGRAVCMTGGHGWWVGREADGEWGVRVAVREQRKAGADCIKFIATGGVLTKGAVPGIEQLSEIELRAGIAEAHTHGMRCAAHAIGAGGIANALRAGIDTIEHGHLVDEAGIALFLERGATLVPTLAAIRCITDNGDDAGMPDFVVRKAREIAERAERNLRAARAAGVCFAGGSDAGTPYNGHDGYAYELELMQSMLGMGAREALRAATVEAARVLGIARGTLGVGDAADLVLLDRDVESDARPYRAPRAVIRDGRVMFERRATTA